MNGGTTNVECMREIVDAVLRDNGLAWGESHTYIRTDKPTIRWVAIMEPFKVDFQISDYFDGHWDLLKESIDTIVQRWVEHPRVEDVRISADPLWDEFAKDNMDVYLERNRLRAFDDVPNALSDTMGVLREAMSRERDYSTLSVCWTDGRDPWHSDVMRMVALPRAYASDAPALVGMMAEEMVGMKHAFREVAA